MYCQAWCIQRQIFIILLRALSFKALFEEMTWPCRENFLPTPLFQMCVLFSMQNLVMYLRLSNTCQMSVLLTYLIIKNGTFIHILWRNAVLDHIMYCGSSDLFCVLHFWFGRLWDYINLFKQAIFWHRYLEF